MKLIESPEEQLLDTLICGDCLSSPPPFTVSLIPFVYSFPVDRIVQKIKYGNEQFWLKPLGHLLSDYFAVHLQKNSLPDLMIPVPLHKKKLRNRGYNQAELLAKHLSRRLGIPYQAKTLVKQKESSDQASLNKQQRLQNLKGCFTLKNAERVKGKHISLVDDVMTSKATAEICSQVLLDHGASRVDIWCIARTPKHLKTD